MKIAYCRYNQNTDLDYAIASVANRNTDQRIGVLEAMVECGYDVTIVSHVSKRHRHAFRGESLGNFDNSWMDALSYDEEADIQDYDLLFVETAAGNSMFSFVSDAGDRKSHVGHFADILRTATGVPILIWNHGPRGLSFPFSRLSCLMDGISEEELSKLSEYNYRNLFKGIDIWDGYTYTVWHQAASDELFRTVFKNHYARPELSISGFIGSATGYSPRYDFIYHPEEFTEFDLAYVGKAGTKERIAQVTRYYDRKLMKSLLIGDGWEKLDWKYNVHAPGKSKGHGDVQDHYIRARACVLVLDNDLAACGMATTRHVQSILSGCLTFADSTIESAERLVGSDEFVVSSPQELEEKLSVFRNDFEDLKDAVYFQQEELPLWADIIPNVVNYAINEGDI